MTRVGTNLHNLSHLATSNNVRVRVIDGHVESKRLQQDVLVGDQLLSFFLIRVRPKKKY